MKTKKHTRKEIIDHRLKQAGWDVTDHTQVIKGFDIHMKVVSQPVDLTVEHLFSGFVLLSKDENFSTAFNVKSILVHTTLGQEQTKQYVCNIIKTQENQLLSRLFTDH